MFTVNTDGSDLRQVIPFGSYVSHFDWRNNTEIIATFVAKGEEEREHFLFTDGKADYQALSPDFLRGDGHCTFSPDSMWLATDRNHNAEMAKSLILYHMSSGNGVYLGMFPMRAVRYLRGDLRCDLHPRWNRTGDKICFDSLDATDWSRQLHIVEFYFSR